MTQEDHLAKQSALQEEALPQHQFDAFQNNGRLIALIADKSQRKNTRLRQEYEIQKMLDFEAEERRNKAQLKFEMQLEKTRSYKEERRLLKARHIKDSIQRAKLLIGDVAMKKPAGVLTSIPGDKRMLNSPARLELDDSVYTFANQCFFGIPNSVRLVHCAFQPQFERLMHAIYNQQTKLDLAKISAQDTAKLLASIPEYAYQPYLQQQKGIIRVTFTAFLQEAELQEIQQAISEVFLRAPYEGPIAAAFGFCLLFKQTEGLTFAEAFKRRQCDNRQLQRILMLVLMRLGVKCSLIEDRAVYYQYGGSDYATMLDFGYQLREIDGYAMFTSFPRFSAQDFCFSRQLSADQVILLRSGDFSEDSRNVASSEWTSVSCVTRHQNVAVLSVKVDNCALIIQNETLAAGEVPCKQAPAILQEQAELLEKDRNTFVSAANASHFGISMTDRLVPEKLSDQFAFLVDRIYAGSKVIELEGLQPRDASYLLLLIPEVLGSACRADQNCRTRISLDQPLDQLTISRIQLLTEDIFCRMQFESSFSAVLGFCAGIRAGDEDDLLGVLQNQAGTATARLRILHFLLLRVGNRARRTSAEVVEVCSGQQTYELAIDPATSKYVLCQASGLAGQIPLFELRNVLQVAVACSSDCSWVIRRGTVSEVRQQLRNARVENTLAEDFGSGVVAIQLRKAEADSCLSAARSREDEAARAAGKIADQVAKCLFAVEATNNCHFGISFGARNLDSQQRQSYISILDAIYQANRVFTVSGVTKRQFAELLDEAPEVRYCNEFSVEELNDGILVSGKRFQEEFLQRQLDLQEQYTKFLEVGRVCELSSVGNTRMQGSPNQAQNGSARYAIQSIIASMLQRIGAAETADASALAWAHFLFLRAGIQSTVVSGTQLLFRHEGAVFAIRGALDFRNVSQELQRRTQCRVFEDFDDACLETDVTLMRRLHADYTVLIRRLSGDPYEYVKAILYQLNQAAEFAVIRAGPALFQFHLRIDWTFEETRAEIDEMVQKAINAGADKVSQPEDIQITECSRTQSAAAQIETPILKYKKTGIISLMIADFDFEAPRPILEALENRISKQIFGYSIYPQVLYDSVNVYFQRRHGITFAKSSQFFVPSVVTGIALALRATLAPGDAVCILDPEYQTLYDVIRGNRFQFNASRMRSTENGFELDWDDLELQMSRSKALLLSNPHNPTGTVFSEADLRRILDICNKYGLYVLVDEIWCDLVFEPARHTPILSLQQQNVFAFYAASKSFNIAGLHMAVTVTQDARLQESFNDQLLATHLTTSNCFGIYGFIAALTSCDAWLAEFRRQLYRNLQICVEYFKNEMPLVRAYVPQATSLLWLDFSRLFDTCEQAEQFCVEHGVCLEKGCGFGASGAGMMRLQCGCCTRRLQHALNQMKEGYDKVLEKTFAGYSQKLSKVDFLRLQRCFPGLARSQIADLSGQSADFEAARAILLRHILQLLSQQVKTEAFLSDTECCNFCIFGVSMSCRVVCARLRQPVADYVSAVLSGRGEYENAALSEADLARIASAVPELYDVGPVVRDHKLVFGSLSARDADKLASSVQESARVADPLMYALDFIFSASDGACGVVEALAEARRAEFLDCHIVRVLLMRCGLSADVRQGCVFLLGDGGARQMALDSEAQLVDGGFVRAFSESIDVQRVQFLLQKCGHCSLIRKGSWFTDCKRVSEALEGVRGVFHVEKDEVREADGYWVHSLWAGSAK